MFLFDGIWISIIPTIIFLLFIVLGILFGIWRGFRKSLILAIQALIIFVCCLILYFVFVNNPSTDVMAVEIANNFLGENGLQNLMGVSSECNSLKEILIQYIPKQLNLGDGIALVLKDNGTYLISIVNLLYHIIFAVIALFLYLIIIFIFYIIYLIAYPERRHKKKILKKYQETDPNKKYINHRGFGALIGGLRGFISGFIIVSLIGGILYIAGGTGENNYEDIDWGDESINQTYSSYKDLGSYGNTGIYKVLNSIKDQNDVPFYLFAANIVLSGNDIENNSSNLVLTKDLGELSKFSRKTIDLVIKYGQDELKDAIKDSKNSGNNDLYYSAIQNVFKKQEFQESFGKLIDELNLNTFFLDMTFSIVDSVASHLNDIDLTNSIPEDALDILNVLFNDSYKSEYIPKDELTEKVAVIKPSMILQKNDIKLVFNVMFNLMGNEPSGDNVLDSINMMSCIMDNISDLTLLNTDKKDTFNPVFERLYTYTANRYLSSGSGNDSSSMLSTSYLLGEESSNSIDWVSELKALISSLNSSLKLFKSNYEPQSELSISNQIVNGLYNIFDQTKADYNNNVTLYNNIVEDLSNSKLLGKVLSNSLITSTMLDILKNISGNKNVYYPSEINYDKTKNEKGEIYNLFNGIESLLKKQESKSVVLKLVNSEELVNNDIKIICKSFDDEVLNYLLDSKIISSVVSAVVFNLNFGDVELVFPDSAKVEINNQLVNLISKDEIKTIAKIAPSLLDCILDKEGSDLTKSILKFAIDKNENITSSNVLCATVANYLVNNDSLSQIVVVSDELKQNDIKKIDCSDNSSVWPNEIKNVLNAINILIDIDSVDFSDSDKLTSNILSKIKSLNEKNDKDNNKTNLDVLYSSTLIKSALSKQLDEKLTNDIVDDYTKTLIKEEDGCYKQDEIKSLVNVINEMNINLNDTSNISNTIVDEVKNLNNYSTIDSNKTKLDVLYSSTLIKSALSKQLDEKLTNDIVDDYTKTLIKEEDGWYKQDEIKSLVNVINEMNINLNDGDLSSKITNQISKLNNETEVVGLNSGKTKLDVLYSSIIVKSVITNKVEEENSIVVPNDAKEEQYIKQDEIKYLIDVIKVYANEDGSIDYVTIKDKLVISKNDFETNGRFIKSKILHATISKYLVEELNKDKTIVFSDSYTGPEQIYIKPIELQALVSTACAINNSDNIGVNIEINTSSQISKDIIKENVANSLIVRALISDTISDNIENEIENIYDNYEITNGKFVILSSELSSLIDVLALRSDSIKIDANVDINNYTIERNDIETLRNSIIVSYKLTKEIEKKNICDADKLPSSAYDENDNYISKNELYALFDILSENNELLISNLNNGNFTSIDESKIEAFKASNIVRYKISNSLPNDIIIPDDSFETDSNTKKLIINNDYKDLLDALVALKLNDSTSINVNNITNDFDAVKSETVAKSIIVRATITDKLEITSNEIKLYYKMDDINSSHMANGTQIQILTELETKNILIGITKMGIESGVSIDINLDTIKNYNEDDLNVILNSNTLRYIISQIISSTPSTENKEKVYLKNNINVEEVNFYTLVEVCTIVNDLKK